jgi:hypothetical protein
MEYLTLDIDPTVLALVAFFCVGTVELIKRAFARDFQAVAVILGSTLTGLGLAFAVDGLTLVTGAAVGLGASGLVTVSSYLGQKSAAPAPPYAG